MALSTHNRLPGQITEVVKGQAAARVSIRVGECQMNTLITRESADELGLEPGQQVMALINATDVMIMPEEGLLRPTHFAPVRRQPRAATRAA